MQVHGPEGVVHAVTVEPYHPGAVALTFRSGEAVTRVVVYDSADCDELIRAAAAAKAMLLGETSPPPVPAAPVCGHTRLGSGTCVMPTGHLTWHRTRGGFEWPQHVQDRTLEAILGNPAWQAPPIEQGGGDPQ